MARNTADTLWPVAFRRLTPALVQSLSEEDFARLCRMVRRRARRRQPTDRHADDLVKRLKKRRFGADRLRRPSDLKRQNPRLPFAKYRDNPILNSLHPRRSKLWIKPIGRTKREHFSLENFSFVDEPNSTMKILSDIAAAECTALTARIDFADEKILDIGPYIVWGLMSKDMTPVLTGGHIAPSVMKVLEAFRLRRFMGMSKIKGIERIRDIWAFTLQERSSTTPTATPERAIGFSKVADKFVDTINEWLGALPQPFELTRDANPISTRS